MPVVRAESTVCLVYNDIGNLARRLELSLSDSSFKRALSDLALFFCSFNTSG